MNSQQLYGANGGASIQDLLAGLNMAQLQRMRQGQTPGGMHGDFVGMTPQRLMMLAGLMKPQEGAGNAQQMYGLQHQQGDGLFQGGGPLMRAAQGGVQNRMGMSQGGPVQAIGGPLQYQGGGGQGGVLPFRTVGGGMPQGRGNGGLQMQGPRPFPPRRRMPGQGYPIPLPPRPIR